MLVFAKVISGGNAVLLRKIVSKMTVGKRSIMVTQTFEDILGLLS